MKNVNDICDVSAEAGIVASVIINPDFVFHSEHLTPHHFTVETNAYLYWAVCKLAKEEDVSHIDAYNIMNVVRKNKCAKELDGTLLTEQTVKELIDEAPHIARATPEEYCMLVRSVMNTAFRRSTYKKLEECKTLCFDMSEDEIEERIYNTLDSVMMENSTATDMPLYKDVVDGIWDEIEARQRGETAAIEFPFPELNRYVVMEPGEVICFAGSAKTGKSSILLTCLVDLLKKDKSVLYIDSEISTKLFTMRILAHLTGIRFGLIRSGNYSEEERQRLYEARAWLKTRKFIHKYLPVFDENAMYLAAKKAKHQIGIDCIIVDYLKSNSAKDEAFSVYTELGRVADTLKNRIAGDMGICGLTAAQAASNGKIADSARIARSVSTVVSITDKSIEEIETDGTGATKKMRVVFNRNGAQQAENEWIDMEFDGSTVTYRQAAIQHREEDPF